MRVLGVNEGHNGSVVVLEDGVITFALQEERINRIKEYVGFPQQALDFALDYLGLSPGDFDAVCLSNLSSPSPDRKREYHLRSYDENAESVIDHLLAGDFRYAQKRAWRQMPGPVRAMGARWRHSHGNADVAF